MLEKIHDILHFWFGDDPSQLEQAAQRWWMKDEAFDNQIRETFEPTIGHAQEGKLELWLEQPTSSLAYVILLDQFPRNIYRNDPKAFSFDEQAKRACLHAIEHEFDKDLNLVQRQFLYMPLEHSEDLDDQRHSVALFAKLLQTAERKHPEFVKMMKQGHQFAVAHYDIIEKFGRFPHRNAILGRDNTEEEVEFLKGPNSGF